MRKTLLLTMILLVSAAWAVAQQQAKSHTTPDASATQGSQPAGGESSFEGCLGGSAGNFTLRDKSGTSYQLDLPQGADTAKLEQHIGQEVRVTGTMANAAGSSSPSGSSPDGSSSADSSQSPGSSAGSQNSIKVSKMDKIADTCSSSASSANPSK